MRFIPIIKFFQFIKLAQDKDVIQDTVFLPLLMGFPAGSDGKESACNVGDVSLFLGLRRFSGEENATRSSILAWRIPWTDEPGV